MRKVSTDGTCWKRRRETGEEEEEEWKISSFVQNFPSFPLLPLPTIMGIEWGWFTSLSLESHGSKVKP